jgi:hypothetical protein
MDGRVSLAGAGFIRTGFGGVDEDCRRATSGEMGAGELLVPL